MIFPRLLKNLIIFLHIEKTAGTSLSVALSQALGKKNFRWISYPELLVSKDLKSISKMKVIAGHFSYGVHRILATKASYVSLIRHPIGRIESFYYYQRSTPTDSGYPQALNNDVNSWLKILYRNKSNLIHNFQSMRLLGMDTRLPFSNESKKNVISYLKKKYVFLDTHENVDLLLKFLSKSLGFNIKLMKSYKVNNSKPVNSEINLENMELLKSLNDLDFYIYESICENPINRKF
jgi:hypothetical protein